MIPLTFNRTPLPYEQKQPKRKWLALPTSGQPPGFDQVANLAAISLVYRLPVCVLCLTQEALDGWRQWSSDQLPAAVVGLDVLDTNQATLDDWQEFLSRQTYDLTVLGGAYAELQQGQVSVGYVTALVKAISGGVVVLA